LFRSRKKAKEAYIMTLLRHGDISAGRAAELLEIEQWQLSDLMDIYQISPFPSQTKEELQQEVTQTLAILSQYKK
jgi:predicted HTH domain antitoxin